MVARAWKDRGGAAWRGEGAGETEAIKEDDFLYEFVPAEGVWNLDQRIDRGGQGFSYSVALHASQATGNREFGNFESQDRRSHCLDLLSEMLHRPSITITKRASMRVVIGRQNILDKWATLALKWTMQELTSFFAWHTESNLLSA